MTKSKQINFVCHDANKINLFAKLKRKKMLKEEKLKKYPLENVFKRADPPLNYIQHQGPLPKIHLLSLDFLPVHIYLHQ